MDTSIHFFYNSTIAHPKNFLGIQAVAFSEYYSYTKIWIYAYNVPGFDMAELKRLLFHNVLNVNHMKE
jgi:hypothetical protein